jgi:hypothetical protein
VSSEIYRLTLDVRDRLVARHFPTPIVYGPERTERQAYHHTHVVFMRDREAPETLGPPLGSKSNPRRMATRDHTAVAMIYARSSLEGAAVQDHEGECDQIVDALVVAITEWASQNKAVGTVISEARYLFPTDHEDVDAWKPGVVYRLRFRVPRGVYALTFEQAARPEQALGGFQNSTQVRQTGASLALDPDTGCGAP